MTERELVDFAWATAGDVSNALTDIVGDLAYIVASDKTYHRLLTTAQDAQDRIDGLYKHCVFYQQNKRTP